MTDSLQIVLLGQPRGKERPRFSTASGTVYTPQKTMAYEAALKFAAQQIMGDRPPLSGPLVVQIVVRVPIPTSMKKADQQAARDGRLRPAKKPDWDNIGKMVDALNLVVWVDDSQIVDGRVQKFYSDKPGMWITVTPAIEAQGVFG